MEDNLPTAWWNLILSTDTLSPNSDILWVAWMAKAAVCERGLSCHCEIIDEDKEEDMFFNKQ